jgi:hypothetical protein
MVPFLEIQSLLTEIQDIYMDELYSGSLMGDLQGQAIARILSFLRRLSLSYPSDGKLLLAIETWESRLCNDMSLCP